MLSGWKDSMESFRIKFNNAANKIGSQTLLHFADSLSHYIDFMIDVSPTDVNAAREFGHHYVSQQKEQFVQSHPYRGGSKVDAKEMAATKLGNVVKALRGNEEVDPEFIPFAIEFFHEASQATTFNEHVQGGAASAFKHPGWMGKKNELETELENTDETEEEIIRELVN